MIEINKSLHGAKGKIKAVYLGTTPVVMYLGDQLLYDVDLDAEYVLMDIKDGDTVDSTIEAPIKSAIFKGQTLVNLYQSKTVTFVGEEKFNVNKDKLIENNKYTLFYEVKENNNNKIIFVDHMQSNKIHTNNSYYIESSIGSHKELLTFKKQENYETNFNWWSDSSQTISIDNIILLEGDYTNVDIPYFTGMQSVKMPVLTTTGKNLLNLSPDTLERLSINGKTGKIVKSNTRCTTKYIKATPKDDLFLKRFNTDYQVAVRYYHDNELVNRGLNLNGGFINDGNIRVASNNNYNQIRLIFAKNNNSEVTPQEVSSQQIMLTNSRDDIFEPYKSNILSCNEDVELRGIGDVKDELNLLTGKLTQRIDEDGSVLTQEVVKTVDLTIQDQDNKIISTLNTFNDTTHFTVQGVDGCLQPTVSMEIACNPSQTISQLSNKTEQLQQEQQELTEQIEQQEQDTNNLQNATTDLEEV